MPTNTDYVNKARPRLDVSTRWNSTLDMITSCLPYAQIFDIMGDEIVDTEEGPTEVTSRNSSSTHVKVSGNCRLSKVG